MIKKIYLLVEDLIFIRLVMLRLNFLMWRCNRVNKQIVALMTRSRRDTKKLHDLSEHVESYAAEIRKRSSQGEQTD